MYVEYDIYTTNWQSSNGCSACNVSLAIECEWPEEEVYWCAQHENANIERYQLLERR